MSARDEWRWTDENGIQRLVRTDELRAALASNVLSPSTLVWRDGMKEWAPAFTMPELADAALAAARSGRPPSTPPPAGSAPPAGEDRSTPTDVMPIDSAPKPGAAERSAGPPVQRPGASPAPGGKPLPGRRPPMRTLVGLSSGEEDRPSVPNVPIVVPSAGGLKPEAARGVITQLPKFGTGGDHSAPAIPQAPRVPSGVPEGRRASDARGAAVAPAGRKARTSEIDALWAGQPPADEQTLTNPLGEGRDGSEPPPAGAAAADKRPPPPATGGVAIPRAPALPAEVSPAAASPAPAATATASASPSRRPPPLPARASAARTGPGTAPPAAKMGPAAVPAKPGPSSSPGAAPPPKPAPAGAPAGKPRSVPPAGPRRAEPASVTPKTASAPPARRPPPPGPSGEKPAATSAGPRERPAWGDLAEAPGAPPPLVARIEAPASSMTVTAPPSAPSSAPSLEDLKNVSLGRTLIGGANAPAIDPLKAADFGPSDDPARGRAGLFQDPTTTDGGSARASEARAAGSPNDARPAGGSASAGHPTAGPASEARQAAGRGPHESAPPPAIAPAANGSASAPTEPAAPPSSPPPAPSERPEAFGRAQDLDLLAALRGRQARAQALRQPVTVPLSSLVYGVGGFVVLGLILSFFVGRCSVDPAEAHPSAQKGIGRAVLVARTALPPPPRPCSVLRNPLMWAPQASKSIPFEIGGTPDGLFAVGYARDEKQAMGITFDFGKDEITPRFEQKSDVEIDRVTPYATGELSFLVSAASKDRAVIHVPAASRFVIVFEESGIGIAPSAEGQPEPLWTLPGDAAPEAPRVLVAQGGAGYALTFRRGGAIWAGWLGPDKKAVGELRRVAGSGGSVGKPNIGFNGRELAVVFADRPRQGSRWEIRVGRAPTGSVPDKTDVIAMPKGGPGGDAFAPDITGLGDGRWLLVWTEGAPGKRAIRGQTLGPDLVPIGDAVALSPPQGNFGQGVLGVLGDRAATVFLSKGESSYELWGAILGCG